MIIVCMSCDFIIIQSLYQYYYIYILDFVHRVISRSELTLTNEVLLLLLVMCVSVGMNYCLQDSSNFSFPGSGD